MPTLPNVTSKFVFDYSDLTKAEKASAKAHGEFQAGAKASTTHTLRFEQSLTTMLDRFGGMPPVMNTAARSLESMTSQGLTGMNLLGGAAAAGLGLVAAAVGESVKAYSELGDKIEDYKRVTGSSAQESSRMVETFAALGVGEEAAAASMFKLSKAIDQHQAKLASLGIDVARQNNGNVDLSRTLFNVADAYNATADQERKNTILLTAFGKSGRDMIPVLEQGSAQLQKMGAAAGLVMSQDDLDRLKQYEINTREATQSWNEFTASLGQQVIPVVNDAIIAIERQNYQMKALTDANKAGKISALEYANAQAGLDSSTLGAPTRAKAITDAAGREFDAGQKLKEGLDSQAQATRDLMAAQDAEAAKMGKLITDQEAAVNAGFAVQLANLNVEESQAKVNQAQEAGNAALAKYGIGSDEYALASDNYTRAVIEQEKAYYGAAAAARKLQEDTDIASGSGKDAAKETKVYVDTLQAEADSLAPDSPLRKRLQAYIDTLKSTPEVIHTTLELEERFQQSSKVGGQQAFAGGGRPPVGVASWIGEQGKELWVPDQPGTIVPHEAAMAASAPSGGDTYNISVYVAGHVVTERELGISLRETLRNLDRELR